MTQLDTISRNHFTDDVLEHLTSCELATYILCLDDRNRQSEVSAPARAGNWSELSRALGFNRTSINDWRHLDGAPEPDADGTHDVTAWVDFLEASDRGTRGGLFNDELTELKRLLTLERTETLRIKNADAMANYLPASIVREEWETKAALAEAVLRRVFEDELPPRILGLDAVAIQRLHQAAIDGVCRELSGQG